uniref:Uncharacterized protein n=1 Tax=Vespula pensylvanica TaxID=30213 RepID=A0A834PCJ0_VESPE|nr:hypothetical protein H0235_003684 [Vespula pensylvanica]
MLGSPDSVICFQLKSRREAFESKLVPTASSFVRYRYPRAVEIFPRIWKFFKVGPLKELFRSERSVDFIKSSRYRGETIVLPTKKDRTLKSMEFVIRFSGTRAALD